MIKPPEEPVIAEAGLGEGKFTPTYSSPHLAPQASAYGTNHPIDKALGRAYRLKSLHAVSKGEPADTSGLHVASSIIGSGHMLQSQQFGHQQGVPSGI